MMRRWVRVLVLLLTVAVTAGVIWRATVNEQIRGRMRLAAQQADVLAADAIFEFIDLRSTLHAYVAPGQGEAFWAARAQTQLGSLRGRVRDLEAAAEAANHPLSAALASLDGLATADKRARASIRDGQVLVAGDIIFTEARDLIDAAVRDLSDARQATARATSSREAGMANEQSLLAGVLMAAWIFALILLVPVPAAPARSAEPAQLSDAGGLQLQLRQMPGPQDAAAGTNQTASERSPRAAVALAAPVVAPVAPVAPDVTPLVQSLADLCADIGRVSEAAELSPLLERAARLMGARGLVVWLASADARELAAAVSHGYDERVLARMGAIAVDDRNVTAAAFRTQAASRTAPEGDVPGAVAVPMLTGSGASGVLAVEVRLETDMDRATALAGVVAAQLASLFPASVASGEPPRHAHAN
jgi:hypothetical protein